MKRLMILITTALLIANAGCGNKPKYVDVDSYCNLYEPIYIPQSVDDYMMTLPDTDSNYAIWEDYDHFTRDIFANNNLWEQECHQ